MFRISRLAALVLLVSALGVSDSTAQSSSPPRPRELNERLPLDLSRLRWGLLQSDAATPHEIPAETRAKRVPLPGVFEPEWGDTCWLLLEFTLPELPLDPAEREPLLKLGATRLTLGEYEGAIRVFVNKTIVYEAPAQRLGRDRQPVVAIVPPEALNYEGKNVLGVRLERTTATSKVGLSGKPMTLAPISDYALQRDIEEASAKIGYYYRTLFRARMAGVDRTALFAELAGSLSEIEQAFGKTLTAAERRGVGALDELQTLRDFLEETESKRFLLESQAVSRIRLRKRELAASMAEDLGIPEDSVRLRQGGYGRFGFLATDGLPGLSEISPTEMAAVPGRGISVRMAGVDRSDVMDIGWTNKITRVAGRQERSEEGRQQRRIEDILLIYYVYASSLFPGGLFDVIMGRELSFELPYAGKDVGVYQYALLGPEYREAVLARYNGPGMSSLSASERQAERELADRLLDEPRITLILPRVRGASPIIFVHENETTLRLRKAGERTDRCILDIATNARSLGQTTVIFPMGIGTVDAELLPKESPGDAVVRIFGENASSFLSAFYRFGARFPVALDEVYHVDHQNGRVNVRDRFIYSSLNPDLSRSFQPAALPPQLIEASRSNYPVQLDPSFRLRMSVPGPDGMFYLGTSNNGVVDYSLPIPRAEERALPRIEAEQGLLDILSNTLGSLDIPDSDRAVDLLHRERTAAYQALASLDADSKQRLLQGEQEIVSKALDPALWEASREPFSSISTYWNEGRIGPYFQVYDQETNNAAVLIALYQLFKYSGDWSLAAEYADFIKEKVWKRLSATDDWGWMRPSNGAHGGGTGAGRSSNAVFAAARSYARIMEHLGNDREADEGYYMYARAALPTLNKFRMNSYAARNGLMPRDAQMLGWQEGEGFSSARWGGYPWPIVSVIDAFGVDPALIDFYLDYGRSEFTAYLEKVRQTWPNWYDGKFDYGKPTAYDGNSGAITLPMIYALSRLGADRDVIGSYIESASVHEGNWWMAPPVLAEHMGGHLGVWFLDWGRLAFRGASLEGGRVSAEFMALKSQIEPTNVRLHLPVVPTAVYVNYERLDAVAYDRESGVLTIPLDVARAGIVWLTIDLDELPPPQLANQPIAAPALREPESLIRIEEPPPPSVEPAPAVPLDESFQWDDKGVRSDEPLIIESGEETTDPLWDIDLSGLVEIGDERE